MEGNTDIKLIKCKVGQVYIRRNRAQIDFLGLSGRPKKCE